MAETLFAVSIFGIGAAVALLCLGALAWMIKEFIDRLTDGSYLEAGFMAVVAWITLMLALMVIALAMAPKTG